ncbi:hypothetical protein BJX61DRAFT_533270 [Aspergillus egyptiacus]|nr:hypothetical protein BJX61DRAFT_533270 [Aspergillus egyptiacus]
MRPPRLLVLAFCLIFFPIFLTFYSVLTSSPRVSTPSSFAGQTTGLHALFSFNLPSSLFPPSAIISLTDENSTFFLARPAAFGPLLPEKGLSGPLWVGNGFGERPTGAVGELGCSDIPGWGEDDSHDPSESRMSKSGSDEKDPGFSQGQRHSDFLQGSGVQNDAYAGIQPARNDGTDDHLHHPLPESPVVESSPAEISRDSYQTRRSAHADIQSLQESAEISGRVVLLSRGGCGFLEKVKWAQRRGAVAVIVGDDTRGGNLVTMYARGDTSNVTIPSMFTSYTTAHLLSSLIPPQEQEEVGVEATKASVLDDFEKSTTPSLFPTPSSTHQPTGDHPTPESKTGVLQSFMSFLGFGRDGQSGNALEHNRRPPSSGNINWIPMDHWDEETSPGDDSAPGSSAGDSLKTHKASEPSVGSAEGDDFVIGVQDWRDPDVIAPRNSAVAVPTGTASDSKQESNKGTQSSSLKGGSITPGSGEYRTVERLSAEAHAEKVPPHNPSGSSGESKSKTHWFSRRLFGGKGDLGPQTEKKQRVPRGVAQKEFKSKEHEGLWVTLTPTSMSTSPFFDTLLVLVISPLLTLSVVYVLLLLRSRIRRRRWRAPKSVVERLPVRTYHTIPMSSSSSSSSLRSSSPGPVTQRSPLLGVKSSERASSEPWPVKSPEPRSFESRGESSGTPTTWRRKYTGRQVECVVCLEEYVDGQSRVMSLPCGHEFHAECITPWLTTRRRTCPICKGDVVRSMSHNHAEQQHPGHDVDLRQGQSSDPVPVSGLSDDVSDLERRAPGETGLEGHPSAASPNWRNFASLSLSPLTGDAIWHRARADNDS